MKKLFKNLFLFGVIFSLLLCVACGQNTSFGSDITAEQILNTATTVQIYDNNKTYIKGKVEMDAFSMSMWSDGVFDECKEFDLISDYAVCYSNDNNTFEISVLKAEKKEDTDKLVSLLERRKQTLATGDKAAYDPEFKMLMEKSEILVEDEFVILLITHDNDAVISAIETLKK